MISMQRTIDWRTIYAWQADYDSTDQDAEPCYQRCGGYCCKNFHADDFDILSSREGKRHIESSYGSEYGFLHCTIAGTKAAREPILINFPDSVES